MHLRQPAGVRLRCRAVPVQLRAARGGPDYRADVEAFARTMRSAFGCGTDHQVDCTRPLVGAAEKGKFSWYEAADRSRRESAGPFDTCSATSNCSSTPPATPRLLPTILAARIRQRSGVAPRPKSLQADIDNFGITHPVRRRRARADLSFHRTRGQVREPPGCAGYFVTWLGVALATPRCGPRRRRSVSNLGPLHVLGDVVCRAPCC